MPDLNSLLLFMIVTITLNVTPGPDMLYVIARSVGQGRAAGIASALGIAAGCFVHILAVTLGLASLLMAVPTAYEIIKYAGAAYLIYLGVRILITRQTNNAETPIEKTGLKAIFLQGVITNILNPKVALFFLAFLPQFVNRDGSFAAIVMAALPLKSFSWALCSTYPGRLLMLLSRWRRVTQASGSKLLSVIRRFFDG